MCNVDGFTLIEVLVSWLLLSIALLALFALDQASLVGARASLLQAVAQSQLDNGLSLNALHDEAAIQMWQSALAQVLPKGQLVMSTSSWTLRWQLPSQQASELQYQAVD